MQHTMKHFNNQMKPFVSFNVSAITYQENRSLMLETTQKRHRISLDRTILNTVFSTVHRMSS